MRVRISDISPKGLEVKGEIPLEGINERIKGDSGSEILFTTAPSADLVITGNASGAELKGTVSAKYQQPCSLCLVEKERTISIKTSFMLKERVESSDEDDDIGIVYYENDLVELTPILEESLILSLALFWHPPFDSSQRCVECKKSRTDLGLGQEPKAATLGDLFGKSLASDQSPTSRKPRR